MQQIDGQDEITSPRNWINQRQTKAKRLLSKPKKSFLVKPFLIDITSLCAVTSSLSIHLVLIKTNPLPVSQYFPFEPRLARAGKSFPLYVTGLVARSSIKARFCSAASILTVVELGVNLLKLNN